MAKKRRKKRAPRQSKRTTAAYRSEEYVMYIAHTEIGISEAWLMRPSLTDGIIESTLRWLAGQLERSKEWPELETFSAADEEETLALVQVSDRDLIAWCVLRHLNGVLVEHGQRSNRDLAGCLRVVLESIDVWTRGPASRGYLAYNRDFVANKLGVQMQLVSEEGEVLSALDEDPVLLDGERGIDLDVDSLAKVGDYLLAHPNDEEAQQAFAYRIMALIARGETDGLVKLCAKLVNEARNKELQSVFLFALGQLQKHEADAEQSIQTLRRAVTADPDYLAGWIALGDAYRADEQFHEAIHAYQAALDIDPDHMPSYDRVVASCRTVGDLDTAVKARRSQVSRFPHLLAPRYNLAQLLYEQAQDEPAAAETDGRWLDKLLGRPQTAAEKLEREIDLLRQRKPVADWHFDDWAVWVRLRLEKEAYDEALYELQKQREEQPHDSDGILLLTAVTLEAAGRTKEAAVLWEDLSPSGPALAYYYTIVQERLGHLLPDNSPLFTATSALPTAGERPYEVAIEPPETAVVSTKLPAPDVINQANELLDEAFDLVQRKKFKAAGRLFQKAHALMPGDASLYGLGLVHMFSHRYEEGYAAFDKVVTMVDDDPDYWFNLGMAATMVDRSGRALQAFEHSLKLGGLEREIRQIARENIKLLRQDVRANQREWVMGRSLDEYVHLEDLFHRGVAAMANNKLTIAVELFRECVAFNERHHQSWGNLGVCLIERGDYDEAEAALKQALALDPDYEIARGNLELLAQKRQEGTIETEIAIVNRPPRPGR